MSTINDSDQFLVERGTTSHKLEAVNLMSTIQDTDQMLIQRGTDSYKVSCLDVKDQLGGGGDPAIITAPTLVATPNTWPSSLTATTATFVNATQDPTYAPWFKDDVQIGGSSGLTYTADSSGVWKYQERWVGDNGAVLFPNAEVTIAQPTVATPSVIAPADGAGQGTGVTYQPETSAITGVVQTPDATATLVPNLPSGIDYRGDTDGIGKWLMIKNLSPTEVAYSNNNLNVVSNASISLDLVNNVNAYYGAGLWYLAGFNASYAGRTYWSASNSGTSYTLCTGLTTNSGDEMAINRPLKFKNIGWFASSNGNVNLFTTTDGKAWQTQFDQLGGGNQGCAVSDTYAVMYASPSTYTGCTIWYSTDLTNWTIHETNTSKARVSTPKFVQGRFVYYSTDDTCVYVSKDETPFSDYIKVSVPFTGNAQPVITDDDRYLLTTGNQLYELSVSSLYISVINQNVPNVSGTTSQGVPKVFGALDNIMYEPLASGGGAQYIKNVLEFATLTLTNDKAYNSADDADMGQTISEVFNAGDTVKADSAPAGTSLAFSTKLYNGNGTGQSINTGVNNTGKSLVWIKATNNPWQHCLYTPVLVPPAGYSYPVLDSSSNAKSDLSDAVYGLQSFSNNGFVLGKNGIGENNSSSDYVTWNFRAAPKFMDIVTYEGTGVVRTVSHSLTVKPGVIICKNIDAASDWYVYHTSLGPTKGLLLDTTNEEITRIAYWNNTEPTATEFTVGSTNSNAGQTHVAYLFADTGSIKCGSYVGNGTVKTVDDVGFKPGWLLIKCTDAISNTLLGNWNIFDSKRGLTSPISGTDKVALFPNDNSTGGNRRVDVDDNGFILGYNYTESSPDVNESGKTYIYVAIAEDATAGNFPPTGTLTADADNNGPTMNLTDVSGVWEDGMKVINDKTVTKGAPDPELLEFVGSTPAAATGTISTWGNATWSVTTGGVTQTQNVGITPGVQQTLNVADAAGITLAGGTTYDVTVKYAAPDCVDNTSAPNTFKTAAGPATFSTTVYPGRGQNQSIDTGVDNTGKSLVWIKNMEAGPNDSDGHYLFDTERGATQFLQSQTTAQQDQSTNSLTAFTSTGIDLGSSSRTNPGGQNAVAWNFKATPNFMDIVTYDGGIPGSVASPRAISHSLGVAPGMTIVKLYDNGTDSWMVWHKELGSDQYLLLDKNFAAQTNAKYFSDTSPTDQVFYVASDGATNSTNANFKYAAYLFADNPTNGIKCGKYPGSGSETTIDCGFNVGWVMIKNISNERDTDWLIMDSKRPVNPISNRMALYPSTCREENSQGSWAFKFEGNSFVMNGGYYDFNFAGFNYIYVAIADTVNTDLFYNINTKETLRGFEIINKHGIEPDSNAAKALGFAELTEQPACAVCGYELQADGRYKPLPDLSGDLARAEETIERQRGLMTAAARAAVDRLVTRDGEEEETED